MKINIFKSKQILAFHLLKFKTYEQFIKKNNINFLEKRKLVDIIINLKKVLKIISQYHNKNKMIVFVGFPNNLRSKINKFTCHFAIDSSSNFQDISQSKKLDIEKSFGTINLLPKSKKKPNLIVLVDHVNVDSIVSKSHRLKIPLIYLNSDFNKKDLSFQNIYKVGISRSSLIKSFYNLFFVSVQFLLFKKVNYDN